MVAGCGGTGTPVAIMCTILSGGLEHPPPSHPTHTHTYQGTTVAKFWGSQTYMNVYESVSVGFGNGSGGGGGHRLGLCEKRVRRGSRSTTALFWAEKGRRAPSGPHGEAHVRGGGAPGLRAQGGGALRVSSAPRAPEASRGSCVSSERWGRRPGGLRGHPTPAAATPRVRSAPRRVHGPVVTNLERFLIFKQGDLHLPFAPGLQLRSPDLAAVCKSPITSFWEVFILILSCMFFIQPVPNVCLVRARHPYWDSMVLLVGK